MTRTIAAPTPGTSGIRTFIFIDMLIFAALFLVFSSERHRLPQAFAADLCRLQRARGLANTLVLLTSSWIMAVAVDAARKRNERTVRWMLCLVAAGGLFFTILKAAEYHAEISNGFTPLTDSFFSLYFFATALHLAHVIGGMIVTLMLAFGGWRDEDKGDGITLLENLGLFWHFVDAVWLYIFALLYLSA